MEEEIESKKQIFFENSTDLLIIINNNTKSTNNNKKYKHVTGPPSDDYKHQREPKACPHPHPSITGTTESLS
jgi:hypothetical protein